MKAYVCDTCKKTFSRDEIYIEGITVKSLDGKKMYRAITSSRHICEPCSDAKYGPPRKKAADAPA